MTSSDSIAIEFLLPAIERLQQRWPQIRVDLEISPQVLNLNRRQADIAFRNVRPEAPDLVARRVAAWPVGLFASEAYLARFGEPAADDELRGHQIVAYRPYLEQHAFSTVVAVPARQARIAMAVNSSLLLRKARVRAAAQCLSEAIEQGEGTGAGGDTEG